MGMDAKLSEARFEPHCIIRKRGGGAAGLRQYQEGFRQNSRGKYSDFLFICRSTGVDIWKTKLYIACVTVCY